jgi:hypothetical protein
MGWVYFINQADTQNYKIGVTSSKTIERRKLYLQTGNASELIICYKFETKYPFRLEKMLHNHYSNTRLVGEWFVLSDEEAIDFKNICEKYSKIVEFLKKENEFY